MADIAREAIEEAFEALPKPRRRDPTRLPRRCGARCAAAIAERWNKKPICHVHMLSF